MESLCTLLYSHWHYKDRQLLFSVPLQSGLSLPCIIRVFIATKGNIPLISGNTSSNMSAVDWTDSMLKSEHVTAVLKMNLPWQINCLDCSDSAVSYLIKAICQRLAITLHHSNNTTPQPALHTDASPQERETRAHRIWCYDNHYSPWQICCTLIMEKPLCLTAKHLKQKFTDLDDIKTHILQNL